VIFDEYHIQIISPLPETNNYGNLVRKLRCIMDERLQRNSVTVIEIAFKSRPSLVQNFIGREDIL